MSLYQSCTTSALNYFKMKGEWQWQHFKYYEMNETSLIILSKEPKYYLSDCLFDTIVIDRQIKSIDSVDYTALTKKTLHPMQAANGSVNMNKRVKKIAENIVFILCKV